MISLSGNPVVKINASITSALIEEEYKVAREVSFKKSESLHQQWKFHFFTVFEELPRRNVAFVLSETVPPPTINQDKQIARVGTLKSDQTPLRAFLKSDGLLCIMFY